MSKIGTYNGVRWVLLPIAEVMASDLRAKWYFVYGPDNKLTGDHYRTLAELKQHVDADLMNREVTP